MTPSGQVAIRLPLALRVVVAAFLAVWVGAIVWTTVVHPHGSSVVVGVVMCAFGVALGYRILRLGVSSGEDGVLHVHNPWASRDLSRGEIEEFRTGTDGGRRLGQRRVMALLRDGTAYNLDVCQAPPFGVGSTRMSRQLDQLNSWLRAR
ncbi:hypothetical protein [Lapillicoccus jejuensis]|uniref:PH (Pleckstrin Homology) domain-containing protein n=1 Tax=Lapillicoccus jejuensis TaxID=402171 RepID=A0A542DVL3_9MICO|nr:hypothetical protein [Lapillicoccus jejuensis]TQJ07141.1 hypothetical protein FB458_0191 [Lapillicoccus jejuensis]